MKKTPRLRLRAVVAAVFVAVLSLGFMGIGYGLAEVLAVPCAMQPDGSCRPYEEVPDEGGVELPSTPWDPDSWIKPTPVEPVPIPGSNYGSGWGDPNGPSGTAQEPAVFVNNVRVAFPDAKPHWDGKANRWLVPVRMVAESMGVRVTYSPVAVTMTRDGLTVVLPFGSKEVQVNGETVLLDSPALLLPPGRTMVPLRFISEAFGADVYWVGDTAPGSKPSWPGRYQVWIVTPW